MLGWLQAVPEGEKQSRASAQEFTLPDISPFEYIGQWFNELGLRFEHKDVQAWVELSGWRPNPKEVELLIFMSRTYTSSEVKFRAKEYNGQPPYIGTGEKFISATDKNLRRFFGIRG